MGIYLYIVNLCTPVEYVTDADLSFYFSGVTGAPIRTIRSWIKE
jgi:hypothetical protein